MRRFHLLEVIHENHVEVLGLAVCHNVKGSHANGVNKGHFRSRQLVLQGDNGLEILLSQLVVVDVGAADQRLSGHMAVIQA